MVFVFHHMVYRFGYLGLDFHSLHDIASHVSSVLSVSSFVTSVSSNLLLVFLEIIFTTLVRNKPRHSPNKSDQCCTLFKGQVREFYWHGNKHCHCHYKGNPTCSDFDVVNMATL